MDTFWKVEESAGGGMYFTHPGIYATEAAAKKEAARYAHARAVLYRTGGWNTGPVRADA